MTVFNILGLIMALIVFIFSSRQRHDTMFGVCLVIFCAALGVSCILAIHDLFSNRMSGIWMLRHWPQEIATWLMPLAAYGLGFIFRSWRMRKLYRSV